MNKTILVFSPLLCQAIGRALTIFLPCVGEPVSIYINGNSFISTSSCNSQSYNNCAHIPNYVKAMTWTYDIC